MALDQFGGVPARLAQGAAVCVCGSPKVMVAGGESVLSRLLGSDTVGQLIVQGRYRRDID